jgi:hypothetical protein
VERQHREGLALVAALVQSEEMVHLTQGVTAAQDRLTPLMELPRLTAVAAVDGR